MTKKVNILENENISELFKSLDFEIEYVTDMEFLFEVSKSSSNHYGYRNNNSCGCSYHITQYETYNPIIKEKKWIETNNNTTKINFFHRSKNFLFDKDSLVFIRDKFFEEFKKIKEEKKCDGITELENPDIHFLDTTGYNKPNDLSFLNKQFYYVDIIDNVLIVSSISRKYNKTISKEKTLIDYCTYTLNGVIKIPLNDKVESFYFPRKKKTPRDPFDIVNINSNTIINMPVCFNNENNSLFSFISTNNKIFDRIGFIDFLRATKIRNSNENVLFLLYVALYAKYPAIELLLKMKHYKLIFNIIENIQVSESRYEMINHIQDLDKIFNDSSKGSMALKVPVYIANYLKEYVAELKDYQVWCDIYELQNISKENFEKIVNSMHYLELSFTETLEFIPNIMKYNYNFEKISKYIIEEKTAREKFNAKNDKNLRTKIKHIAMELRDYLNMADMLGIESNRLPSELKKQHDDLSRALRVLKVNEQNKKEQEKMLKIPTLANLIEKYLIENEIKSKESLEKRGLKKKDTIYEIIVPASIQDFINEGNMQNNCVGSYYRNVMNDTSIIFFIRKKENPEKSFITAECSFNGRLKQIMYKNNVPVTEKEILDYATGISKKIARAIK